MCMHDVNAYGWGINLWTAEVPKYCGVPLLSPSFCLSGIHNPQRRGGLRDLVKEESWMEPAEGGGELAGVTGVKFKGSGWEHRHINKSTGAQAIKT